MTTGTCIVLGELLMRRQTSKPSIPGIMTSSSTTSTRSVCRMLERLLAGDRR